MPRKWYGRPGQQIMEDLAEQRALPRSDMERIIAHAPLWVDDPGRIGLDPDSHDTAAYLYGLGASFPRSFVIESYDVVWPNAPTESGNIELTFTSADGRTVTVEVNGQDWQLIKGDYGGLVARMTSEGFGDPSYITS